MDCCCFYFSFVWVSHRGTETQMIFIQRLKRKAEQVTLQIKTQNT